MSVLKFTHYQVRAHEKGVKLERVKGLCNTYTATTRAGIQVYMYSDEDMIRFVNSL